jgi:hypothetical protein
MRKKCAFEKFTDVMIVGGLVVAAFCFGAKFQEKRGVR